MLHQRIRTWLDLVGSAVSAGKIPGAVTLVGRGSEILALEACGHAQLIPHKEPMTPDTLFDVASLTKLTAVWSGVMRAFDSGLLAPDTRIADVLSGPIHPDVAPRTVFELLTHTAGLVPFMDTAGNTRAERIRSLLLAPPLCRPGEKVLYSDLSFIFLGEMLAAVYGKPLEAVAADVWRAFGMRDTCFNPAPGRFCAATEVRPGTELPVRGRVHDERAEQLSGVAGHAGVFSTARDLARFCAAVTPATLNPVLPERWVRESFRNQTAHLGGNRCLGWIAYRERSEGNVVGHTGFTGASIWLDTVSGLCCVLLTNRIHPSRENPALAAIRTEGLNILYGK